MGCTKQDKTIPFNEDCWKLGIYLRKKEANEAKLLFSQTLCASHAFPSHISKTFLIYQTR